VRQYKLLGIGRHRTVLRWRNWVLKIPHHEMGFYDNWKEARTFRECHYPEGNEQYARCRLLKNGWLLMEYVEHMPWQSAPHWADCIDCRQVGYNRRGAVVAYDFA